MCNNGIRCEREEYMALLYKTSSSSLPLEIPFKSPRRSQHASAACKFKMLRNPVRENAGGRIGGGRGGGFGGRRISAISTARRPLTLPPRIFRKTSTLPTLLRNHHHPTNAKRRGHYTSCSHPVVHLRAVMTRHSKCVPHARHARGDATRPSQNVHYVLSNLTHGFVLPCSSKIVSFGS